MAGLLDWVDPAREWWKSRPEVIKGLLSGAYSMATDQATREAAMARLPKPFDRSVTGEQMMNNALNAGPSGLLGKIVYHGSPHKFDKFDASKIGTGEGAQAYGHGVYLADSDGVAKSYSRPEVLDVKRSKDGVTARLNTGEVLGPFKTTDEINSIINANKGSLYKADLPDEWIPKMLDWDKPLSQQPEISGLLKMRVIKETEPSDSKFLVEFSNGVQTGFRTKREAQAFVDTATGGDVIRHMSPTKGTQYTKDLSALGIPGIRYLDGGSRSAGQGSYNYVVFPGLEDQVKILERNGIPLSGLLGR